MNSVCPLCGRRRFLLTEPVGSSDDTQQALVDSATQAIRTRFPSSSCRVMFRLCRGLISVTRRFMSLLRMRLPPWFALRRKPAGSFKNGHGTGVPAAHHWHGVPGATELDKSPRNADLMPICCGFGVLGSEACLYDDQWSQAGWAGWSISRSGYYSTVEIGYALALLARCRNETSPDWDEHLRLDSRETAALAWKFFASQEKLGRSLLFDAETIPSTQADMSQLATWLSIPIPLMHWLQVTHSQNSMICHRLRSSRQSKHHGRATLMSGWRRVLGKGTRTPELERCVMDLCRKGKPLLWQPCRLLSN